MISQRVQERFSKHVDSVVTQQIAHAKANSPTSPGYEDGMTTPYTEFELFESELKGYSSDDGVLPTPSTHRHGLEDRKYPLPPLVLPGDPKIVALHRKEKERIELAKQQQQQAQKAHKIPLVSTLPPTPQNASSTTQPRANPDHSPQDPQNTSLAAANKTAGAWEEEDNDFSEDFSTAALSHQPAVAAAAASNVSSVRSFAFNSVLSASVQYSSEEEGGGVGIGGRSLQENSLNVLGPAADRNISTTATQALERAGKQIAKTEAGNDKVTAAIDPDPDKGKDKEDECVVHAAMPSKSTVLTQQLSPSHRGQGRAGHGGGGMILSPKGLSPLLVDGRAGGVVGNPVMVGAPPPLLATHAHGNLADMDWKSEMKALPGFEQFARQMGFTGISAGNVVFMPPSKDPADGEEEEVSNSNGGPAIPPTVAYTYDNGQIEVSMPGPIPFYQRVAQHNKTTLTSSASVPLFKAMASANSGWPVTASKHSKRAGERKSSSLKHMRSSLSAASLPPRTSGCFQPGQLPGEVVDKDGFAVSKAKLQARGKLAAQEYQRPKQRFRSGKGPATKNKPSPTLAFYPATESELAETDPKLLASLDHHSTFQPVGSRLRVNLQLKDRRQKRAVQRFMAVSVPPALAHRIEQTSLTGAPKTVLGGGLVESFKKNSGVLQALSRAQLQSQK